MVTAILVPGPAFAKVPVAPAVLRVTVSPENTPTKAAPAVFKVAFVVLSKTLSLAVMPVTVKVAGVSAAQRQAGDGDRDVGARVGARERPGGAGRVESYRVAGEYAHQGRAGRIQGRLRGVVVDLVVGRDAGHRQRRRRDVRRRR